MPLDAIQALLTTATFVAMGTSNTVVVDEPAALAEARAAVGAEIAEIDRVCSRFRADSELSALNRAHGRRVRISPLLEEALLAALRAAEMTGGLVDPTVGPRVEEAGYTVTFRDLPLDGPPLELRVEAVAGYEAIDYDPRTHSVLLPPGVSLDLGASGKAWAADRAADTVLEKVGVPVVVDCGGDLAVRGRAPAGGWPVRVAEDVDAATWEDVTLFDGGFATSGTGARRWRRGGVELHHIIDPSTGLPVASPWRTVSVAAATCLEANAAATAALILGGRAIDWLTERGLPARLVEASGAVAHTRAWVA